MNELKKLQRLNVTDLVKVPKAHKPKDIKHVRSWLYELDRRCFWCRRDTFNYKTAAHAPVRCTAEHLVSSLMGLKDHSPIVIACKECNGSWQDRYPVWPWVTAERLKETFGEYQAIRTAAECLAVSQLGYAVHYWNEVLTRLRPENGALIEAPKPLTKSRCEVNSRFASRF